MKYTIQFKTIALIVGLMFLSSCQKEIGVTDPNEISPAQAAAMLQGAWDYQGGLEEWHITSPVSKDTTIVNPEYPMVHNLRFMADGTAYIEFNTYNQFLGLDALMYQEQTFLWALSEYGNTLMLTDANWEMKKWQVLSLTDSTLSLSFKLADGSLPAGCEITCTYAYRHK